MRAGRPVARAEQRRLTRREQLAILRHAVRLCKAGGRLVYSTCSLNPHEDEAVVAAVLREAPGVELVDVSGEVPGLRRRAGLTTWGVYDASGAPVARGSSERFPATLYAGDDGAALGLTRCMRFLPQDQDTGGFFVAVLRVNAAPAAETGPVRGRSTPGGRRRGEAPLRFLSGDEAPVPALRAFYDAPRLPAEQLAVRGAAGSTIHFLSAAAARYAREGGAKVIGGGLKAFRRHTLHGAEHFRLSNEGLAGVAVFLGAARRVDIGEAELRELLAGDTNVVFGDAGVWERYGGLSPGTVFFRVVEGAGAFSGRVLSGWKSRGFSLFMSRVERAAVVLAMGLEVPSGRDGAPDGGVCPADKCESGGVASSGEADGAGAAADDAAQQ